MSAIVERLRDTANYPTSISTTVKNGVRHWEIGCEKKLLLDAADEIEKLRKDLETERKKHEWVSVEDRLPEQDFQENDNKVAVLLEDGSVDFAHRMAGTTVFVSPSRVYLREVTHWWSLPDPPKGEEDVSRNESED